MTLASDEIIDQSGSMALRLAQLTVISTLILALL